LGITFEAVCEETWTKRTFLRGIFIISGWAGFTGSITAAGITIRNAFFACKVFGQRTGMMLKIVAFLALAAELGLIAWFAVSDSTIFTSLSVPEISRQALIADWARFARDAVGSTSRADSLFNKIAILTWCAYDSVCAAC
jgi:hypothetical protein